MAKATNMAADPDWGDVEDTGPEPKMSNPMGWINAEVMMTMKVAQRPHLIAGILSSEGGTILAADAKTGKSSLALEMCRSITMGEPFLGEFPVIQGGAVYWQADDVNRDRFIANYQRLTRGRAWPQFIAAIERRQVVPDGILELEAAVKLVQARLVVIDCLSAVRGRRKAGEDFVASEYNELSILNEFAAKHHCCVLILHHMATGARGSKNVFNAMAGSFAIGAAPDNMMVIQTFTRSRTERFLLMQGRDVGCVPVVYARGEDEMLFHVANGALADEWDEAYRLYLAIGDMETMTGKDIGEAIGVSDRMGRYKAVMLRQAGVITELAGRRYRWDHAVLQQLQEVRKLNGRGL